MCQHTWVTRGKVSSVRGEKPRWEAWADTQPQAVTRALLSVISRMAASSITPCSKHIRHVLVMTYKCPLTWVPMAWCVHLLSLSV